MRSVLTFFILWLICLDADAGLLSGRDLKGSSADLDSKACMTFNELVDPVEMGSGFYSCIDNTVSYVQPSQREVSVGGLSFSRTGLCGATAASNVQKIYCNAENRVGEFDASFIEGPLGITVPMGTTMQSLRDGLKAAWRSQCLKLKHRRYEWRLTYRKNDKEYLQYLYRSLNWDQSALFKRTVGQDISESKWPLIVTIHHEERGGLHIVTVVDIETSENLSYLNETEGSLHEVLENKVCNVVFNTWGNQYRASCLDFTHWAFMPRVTGAEKFFARFSVIDLIDKPKN